MSAMQAIGKAAESAGQKAPVTANKSLTGLQDFHTSMLDKVRENAVNARKEMDAFDYQYDKGQRVFTEDSAKKNRAPYEILERYRHGNQVMRGDHPTLGANMGQPIRDPDTGKVMRTPYEAGYRVRGEIGEMIIPESAIKGAVDKAKGGAIRMQVGGLSKMAQLAKGAKKAVPEVPFSRGVKTLSREESDENLRKMLDQSRIKERLFHATPEEIKFFKPGGLNPKVSGEAVWLSNDPRRTPAAHNIGTYDDPKQGVNVMPVYVQAKNPMVIDDESMLKWAREVYGEGSSEFPYLMPKKWREEVMKDYDSIVLADPYKRGDSHEIIMFEPEKIKSATGNRGTYNTDTADITKAKGGAIRMQVGGLSALANAGKAGTLANRLSRSESAGMRARQFADPLNPDDIMRMSEALGYAGAEGKTLNLTQADRSRVFGPNKGGTGFSGLQLTSPEHKKARSTWGVGKPSHLTRLTNATNDDTI